MMNLVELEISKTQAIKIYLPCQKEDVGSFDIISVKYFREQMEYDLYVNDFAAEAIISLKNMLEEALNFKLQIQNKYLDKGIGITIIFIIINCGQLTTQVLLIQEKTLFFGQLQHI